MDSRYLAMATPPEDALKKIEGGNLKGKSDINAQWKIEALTEQFGLCGIGWKYEIVDKLIQPLEDGQILLYMQVNLYVKDKETNRWSDPIIGYGGDFIVTKNKNGLVPNDEAFKMCLTDALGNAFKYIGVAADVYRGLFDSKYTKRNETRGNTYGQSANAQKPPVANNQRPPANNQQQPANSQQPAEPPTEYVKNFKGATCILGKDGTWYALETMPLEHLQAVIVNPKYAKCHAEATRLYGERKGA